MNNSVVMNESMAEGVQTKTLWPSTSGTNYKQHDSNNEEFVALKQKYEELNEQF